MSTNDNRTEKGKDDNNGIIFVGGLSSFRIYSKNE